jgi:hypothetical protein
MAQKKGKGSRLKADERLFVESLLASVTPHAIIRREIQKRFGINERRASAWISYVYALLAEEAKPQAKDERRAQMRNVLGDFYQKAVLAKNFNAAVTALDRMCKLDGLYAPEQHDVRHQGALDRDPDRVRQRIRELARKNPHLFARGGILQPPPEDEPKNREPEIEPDPEVN